MADRQTWGAIIKQLHVGAAWRFSINTMESLFVEVRQIPAPDCVSGAPEGATQMNTTADSVVATAHLLEEFARLMRVDATGGGIWRGTAAP